MSYFLSFFLFVASPIWPLGDPVPGDPLIIINKYNNQLVWVNDSKIILQTSVATGKTNTSTPEGLFTITVKAKNPYYRKKNISGGDVRNPLGTRWIGFDARHTDGRIYGIHGTNEPSSVGKYISNGCIRLSKKDIEFLYEKVPVGTKVYIVHSKQTFAQIARQQKVR